MKYSRLLFVLGLFSTTLSGWTVITNEGDTLKNLFNPTFVFHYIENGEKRKEVRNYFILSNACLYDDSGYVKSYDHLTKTDLSLVDSLTFSEPQLTINSGRYQLIGDFDDFYYTKVNLFTSSFDPRYDGAGSPNIKSFA